MLNSAETRAVTVGIAVVFVLAFSLGLVLGGAAADGYSDTAERPSTVTVNLPNESVMQRTIAAARQDQIVDQFCSDHGFDRGYPSSDTNAHYFIRCHSTENGVDRSKEFSLFEDFAEYVEQGEYSE